MPIGAGRYNDVVTWVREHTDGDLVALIILGGPKGPSFEVQTRDPALEVMLPGVLRVMADQIERDIRARGTS
jgi:hypothetical protein